MSQDSIGPYIVGPTEDSNYGIYHGDAKLLANDIPDCSVDLVFTDPLYDEMGDYLWLAKLSQRVLKQPGACLAFCGAGYLMRTMLAMYAGGLRYRWLIPVIASGGNRRCDVGLSRWMALLWFETEHPDKFNPPGRHCYDVIYSAKMDHRYHLKHRWSKNVGRLMFLVERFTSPNAIILDPFCGGGSLLACAKITGRRWLGFEQDGTTLATTRANLQDEREPLTNLYNQLDMFKEEE